MASGTLIARIAPTAAMLPTSNFANFDINNSLVPVLALSDTSDVEAYFLLRMPSSLAYGGGGIRIDGIVSTPAGASTAGSSMLGAAVKRVADSVDDLTFNSAGAEKTILVPAPTSAQGIRAFSFTFAASEIDSILADDWFLVRLRRIGSHVDDNMVGKLHFVAAELREV
jgi:hypothetical protein